MLQNFNVLFKFLLFWFICWTIDTQAPPEEESGMKSETDIVTEIIPDLVGKNLGLIYALYAAKTRAK